MQDWRLGLLAIGFLGLLNSWVNGQVPGSLDASFGVDGAVTIDLGPDETCARLLTDAEGNFYFLGNISRYDSVADLDFLVGKCKPDGKLDIGFGDGGHLSGDFGGFRNSRILDADLRDGAIYLIGEGGNGSLDTQQVFIGKLGLNGEWDADFGLNGFFTRKFVGEWAAAGAIKALEDGRIAYCGMTTDTNAWHIELPMAGRLLANGLADSSFGNTGCIAWSLARGLAAARAPHSDGGKFETILPMQGGLLLGGVFYTSSYGRAMLMMVDAHGNLDDGFGENGLLFPDISPGFTCTVTHSVKKDNRIYLGATLDVYQQGEDFALLTLDSTGSFLDYNGIDFGGNEDKLKDMLVDHRGRLLLGGHSRFPGSNGPGFESDGFAVAALEDRNHFATEFAEAGKWMEPMRPGFESGATAMCATTDGKLLVAGYVAAQQPGNYSDLLIVRLLLDSISPDPSPIPPQGPMVFPNPAKDRIQIHSDEGNTCSIWDSQGKLIMENVDFSEGIDIGQLNAGVYLLQVNGVCIRFLKE